MFAMNMIIPEHFNKPIKELPFVILDLETTGFKPQDAGITEVAVISVVNGNEETFETLINPGYPIPAAITKLTGITEDMVCGKPSISEILPVLSAMFENCIFVSHNVPFDWAFIDYAFRKHLKKTLTMPSLCTLHLSRKYLGLRSNKLESVASYFKVNLENAHRAMNDTKAVKDILFGIIDHLDKHGIKHGSDLYSKKIIFPDCPPRR